MLRSFWVGLLALACLAVSGTASEDARPLTLVARSGQYVFYIQARNAHFRNITRGFARAYVSGRTARIEVDADGYRSGRTTVFLRDNQTSYQVPLRLEDPSVSLDVRDQDRQTLSHRSRDENQMVFADEFRFSSRISAEGFSKFKASDLRFRVNGLSAYSARVQVFDRGSEREIQVTFSRRHLGRYSNRLELFVPDDESLAQGLKTPEAREALRQEQFKALVAASES